MIPLTGRVLDISESGYCAWRKHKPNLTPGASVIGFNLSKSDLQRHTKSISSIKDRI